MAETSEGRVVLACVVRGCTAWQSTPLPLPGALEQLAQHVHTVHMEEVDRAKEENLELRSRVIKLEEDNQKLLIRIAELERGSDFQPDSSLPLKVDGSIMLATTPIYGGNTLGQLRRVLSKGLREKTIHNRPDENILILSGTDGTWDGRSALTDKSQANPIFYQRDCSTVGLNSSEKKQKETN